MSTFLRERAKGVADNLLASLLIAGGSAVVAWIVQHWASIRGLGKDLSIPLGIAAFLFLCSALLLLRPTRKPQELGRRGPAPPQPIILNDKPVFNNAPQINQNPIRSQTQRQSQTQGQFQKQATGRPPSLEALPVKIQKASVDVTGEVTHRDRSVFEGEELTEMDVAFAEFYRPTDESGESWIDVRGHLEFYNTTNGELERRVNDALWWKAEGKYVTFHQGDSKKVIVAIVHNSKIFPYQGLYEETGEWYGGTTFKAEAEPLEGKSYRVEAVLIGTRGGVPKMKNQMSNYDLSINEAISWKLMK